METNHYASETVVIKCRVKSCQLSLMRKNYKEHLNKKHPKENPQDLSPFGQIKISSFFSRGPPVPVRGPEKSSSGGISQTSPEDDHGEVGMHVDEVDVPGHEDGRDIIAAVGVGRGTCESLVVNNLQGSLGKRRHPSADSGINEDDEDIAETSVKKKKSDDLEPDDKLDKILSEIEQLKSKIDCGGIAAGGELHTVHDKKPEGTEEEVLKNLCVARSMEDFERIGFKYDGESQIFCSVCEPVEPGDAGQVAGVFFYDRVLGLEFEDDEVLPQEFCNLKKSLKRHINCSKSHSESVKSVMEKENAAKELMSKNQKAGMNLGNICMKNYKLES